MGTPKKPWFSYDPADALRCLPAGKYVGTLREVSVGSTVHGLPLLKLTWAVTKEGLGRTIYGWIVNPTSLYLLAEIADASDERKAFDAGSLDINALVGLEATLELEVVRDSFYGEHNWITAYGYRDGRGPHRRSERGVPSEPRGWAARAKEQAPEINEEDIPF